METMKDILKSDSQKASFCFALKYPSLRGIISACCLFLLCLPSLAQGQAAFDQGQLTSHEKVGLKSSQNIYYCPEGSAEGDIQKVITQPGIVVITDNPTS